MPLIESGQVSEHGPDLLAEARRGSPEALEQLLEEFRPQLEVLVDQELSVAPRSNARGSEITEETLREAERQFPAFTGESTSDLLVWLNSLLFIKLDALPRIDPPERLPTATTDSAFDVTVGPDSLDDSLVDVLIPSGTIAAERAKEARVMDALTRAPSAHRDAIRMRYWEDLSFAEVAGRLNRTEDSVRLLWARAIEQLRRAVATDDQAAPVQFMDASDDRDVADLLAAYDETLAGRGDMFGILGPAHVSEAATMRVDAAREIIRLIRDIAPHVSFPPFAQPPLKSTLRASDLPHEPRQAAAPLWHAVMDDAPAAETLFDVPGSAPTDHPASIDALDVRREPAVVQTPTWQSQMNDTLAPTPLTAPPEAVESMPTTAEFAGRYLIQREVVRNERGVVYEAFDATHQRTVALKLLTLPTDRDHKWFHGFLAAVPVYSQLRDPHVVHLFDAGLWNGQAYLVQEFVVGARLDRFLGNAPQPPDAAASCVADLARAVHEAHSRSILHQDLTPASVLLVGVSKDSAAPLQRPRLTIHHNPKIKDFGLKLRPDDAEYAVQQRENNGVLTYQAPELVEGWDPLICPATDVYALGAILYEMLTGRPPFQGLTAADVRFQVVNVEPVPPSRLQLKLPRDLETICLQCLRKDGDYRYRTAKDLADDLEQFRAGRPVKARRASLLAHAWRWSRANRRQAGVTSLVALALFSIFIGAATLAAVYYRKSNEANAAARLANDRVYAADLMLVQRAWEDHNPSRLRELLDSQLPNRTDGVDRRGFEWYYWRRLSLGERRTIQGPGPRGALLLCRPDGSSYVSLGPDQLITVWNRETQQSMSSFRGATERAIEAQLSPDGKQLAAAYADGTVRIFDLNAGKTLHTLRGHTAGVTSIGFSPDGQSLASASADHSVRVWDATSGRAIQTLLGHTYPASSVGFSANGQLVASGAQDGVTRIWSVTGGQEKQALPGHKGAVLAVAWSPDGRRLASASADRTVKLWDASTGKEMATLTGHSAAVRDVCFGPDGRRLATGSADQTVKVWNADTGAEIATLTGHTDQVNTVAVSKDGQRLFSTSSDQTIREWYAQFGDETLPLAQSAAGRNVSFSRDGRFVACATADNAVVWDLGKRRILQTLARVGGSLTWVCFSPDGQRLACAAEDRSTRIFDLNTGQEVRSLQGHQGPVLCVSYSPDGQRLATASLDRNVIIWDSNTGQIVRTLSGHGGGVNCVSFSPDGKRVASASHDGSVKIWDVATGNETASLQGHSLAVLSVCFSPDGKRLASGSSDRTAIVWNAATGEPTLTLNGHTGFVTQVTFSPDGKRLATASWDQSVRLWDSDHGFELLTLKGHRGKVNSVSFNADGEMLATASADYAVKLWLALRN